jgi:hypothetical protein
MSESEEYDGEVISQLAAVRASGGANMINKTGVKRIAQELDFQELVDFIEESDNETYMDYLKEMGERR